MTELTAREFTGLGVALATPFRAGQNAAGGAVKPAVDHPAYERLIRHVLADGRGVDYLIVLGSTGESATVTDDERRALVRQAVDLAGGVPVVVGVGHNDTERTCALATMAAQDGADGLLVVTPFYNKPQVSGLVAHYRAVATAAPSLPIIAYNVPGRTGCNITAEALQQLWRVPQVVAIKESSGDLRQIGRMCQQVPQGRAVLAGDDDLALAAIAVGAQGLVSVCANVAPEQTRALVDAARSGDLLRAREMDRLLAPLMRALFTETNPVPVKAALACLGLGSATVRLPLSPAEPDTWTLVQGALTDLATARQAASAAPDPTGHGMAMASAVQAWPSAPDNPAALQSDNPRLAS